MISWPVEDDNLFKLVGEEDVCMFATGDDVGVGARISKPALSGIAGGVIMPEDRPWVGYGNQGVPKRLLPTLTRVEKRCNKLFDTSPLEDAIHESRISRQEFGELVKTIVSTQSISNCLDKDLKVISLTSLWTYVSMNPRSINS